MTYKLDLKDKRLLYELDQNSRQSCSQIAKKIKLSTEVVNYRIRKLENENIITQYQLIANLSALNIKQFKICLSLQHMNSAKLNEIINQLKQLTQVKWIVSCSGNWDLIISAETDSLEKIEELKDEIVSLFEGYVSKKAVAILIEAQTYTRNYFLDSKDFKKSRIIMKQEKIIEIDELDLKILKTLAENSRKQIVEIASELKQSVRVINYRIKQLEKKKIILGYKMAVNYEKL